MEFENNKKIDLSIPAMTISFGTKSSNTSVANAFASKGIKTIRDLCLCTEEELVKLPTVGYGRSLLIRKFLKMYGLELGMTEEKLTAYETNAREEEMVAKLTDTIRELLPLLANLPNQTQQLNETTERMKTVLQELLDKFNDLFKKFEDLLVRVNHATELFYVERVAYENYKKELAKDLWERRRFELAEYLYSKEKGCFCSDKEKAERAVRKADILLDMLKK
jgi:hypothetical protein